MAELGLDRGLTASQDLGIDKEASVADFAPDAKPKTGSDSVGGLQKFGLAIEAFGAGMQGRTPLYMKQKEQEMQQRRQNLADMAARLSITEDVTKQIQSVPEDKRQEYLDILMGQYDDPKLKEMLNLTIKLPDVLSGTSKAVKEDPLIRSITAQGKLPEFLKTEAGQKYMRELQYPEFAREWSGRAEEWQNWTRTNRPDDYQRIMKDGRLTTTELMDILESLPENLKPTPQSRSYFLSESGQERLTSVIGLPVVTDKLAQKKIDKEFAGDGSTTLSKHLAELEEAERDLAGADDGTKKSAQRRVDALKRKVASESTPGGADALKEMRNQIIVKTAKMKEKDPAYRPPQHEQYILDEYNKANAIERLRREVLEGSGEQLPKVTSDAEYEALESGTRFIDPQGKTRTKP